MSARTPDQITAELSKITLRQLDALEPAAKVYGNEDAEKTVDRIRSLVLSARAAQNAKGPVTRPAEDAERHDDYLAVVQLALAMGHDGRLSTSHRADAPKHALVPLAAALRHLTREIERELRGQLGLSRADFDDVVQPIVRGLEAEDFANIRLEIADASRTEPEPEQPPKLILPG